MYIDLTYLHIRRKNKEDRELTSGYVGDSIEQNARKSCPKYTSFLIYKPEIVTINNMPHKSPYHKITINSTNYTCYLLHTVCTPPVQDVKLCKVVSFNLKTQRSCENLFQLSCQCTSRCSHPPYLYLFYLKMMGECVVQYSTPSSTLSSNHEGIHKLNFVVEIKAPWLEKNFLFRSSFSRSKTL